MCPYPSSGHRSGNSGLVEDVRQLLLTDANVQGARASSYDIKRDGAMKYLNGAKAELDEQQHKKFIQLIHDSMNKNADISDINQRKSILFAEYPELEEGFDLFFNLPTPTPTPTQQNTCVVLNPLGAAQHLCQQSEPIDTPTTILVAVQPPVLTRPLVALYPPPVVRVLDATMDLETVSAFAKLYRDDGTDVTKLLEGNMNGIYSNGDFRFPDLKISGKGSYIIKISLWHLDNFVGFVDSKEIFVGDRPLLNNPIMDAQEIQFAKRQLYWQDIDDNVKDDPEGLFPNWNYKIHTSSSVITVGGMRFTKIMVLIPESAFTRGKFDDGLYEITDGLGDGLGDGLFTDESRMWYDDGEVERAADSQDSLIHPGTDGELYRREQVFEGSYVALERRAAWIGGITCIAHIVLL